MTVHFLNDNTPEAVLQEVMREKPDAFVCVYLKHGDEVVVAGDWHTGRIQCLGMLCEALDSIGHQGRTKP